MAKVLLPHFDKRPIIVWVKENEQKVQKVLTGLVIVVVQDHKTGKILMVAYTDKAGYLETLRTGQAVYYSTSRLERWLKGETSGDLQYVKRILLDCDGDAVIYQITQSGEGACHTGAWSCFYRDAIKGKITETREHAKEDELLCIEASVHESFLCPQ